MACLTRVRLDPAIQELRCRVVVRSIRIPRREGEKVERLTGKVDPEVEDMAFMIW